MAEDKDYKVIDLAQDTGKTESEEDKKRHKRIEEISREIKDLYPFAIVSTSFGHKHNPLTDEILSIHPSDKGFLSFQVPIEWIQARTLEYSALPGIDTERAKSLALKQLVVEFEAMSVNIIMACAASLNQIVVGKKFTPLEIAEYAMEFCLRRRVEELKKEGLELAEIRNQLARECWGVLETIETATATTD